MKKLIGLLILSSFCFGQIESPLFVDSLQLEWVNSQYESMSLDERVGQLFVVAAYSNRGAEHENEIENLVKNEHIGGLIFMQDIATRQAELNNRYNQFTKIPLLIGMDAEWGLAMRLKGVDRFPWAMTVGAVQDNELVKEMGRNIGEQAARMGVSFNFAPDVDVNTNPLNPIIGNRSFGSDVNNVSEKGIAYMQGMLEMGVLSSAKHFPGHGDTSQDSHHTTPLVAHDLERLKSVELATFQRLIDAGVPAVMISHLNVPALDDSGIPATLSKKIIIDLLKNEMGFNGLVITDALNMDGVAKAYPPGIVDLMAFEAGNDILLFSQDVKTAKQKIIEKINSGEISEQRLEESVKKILMAKYKVGLNDFKPLNTNGLPEELNKPEYASTTFRLYREAMSLIKNDEDLIYLENYKELNIAYVPLEESDYQHFYECMNHYTKVDLVKMKTAADIKKLKNYDLVIIGFHKSNETVYKSYKISDNSKEILKAVSAEYPTVLTVFGSPYALSDLDLTKTQSVLLMYQNLKTTHEIAAKAIFEETEFRGKLPADVNEELKFGMPN